MSLLKIGVMPWKLGVGSVVRRERASVPALDPLPVDDHRERAVEPELRVRDAAVRREDGAVADENLVPDRVGDLVVPRIADRAAREAGRRAADLEVETGAPAAAPGDVLPVRAPDDDAEERAVAAELEVRARRGRRCGTAAGRPRTKARARRRAAARPAVPTSGSRSYCASGRSRPPARPICRTSQVCASASVRVPSSSPSGQPGGASGCGWGPGNPRRGRLDRDRRRLDRCLGTHRQRRPLRARLAADRVGERRSRR